MLSSDVNRTFLIISLTSLPYNYSPSLGYSSSMNYQSRPQGNIYSSPHGHPTPSCHGPSPRLPPHNPRLHVTPKHTHVRFHHRVGSYSIQRRASINTFFLHVWIFSWRPNLFWVAWWTALRIWRNIQKEMWRVHRPLEPRWWKCTLCAWLTKSQRHIFVTAFVRYTIRFCRDNFKLSLHSDWRERAHSLIHATIL